jgi:bifunctional phosphoglucose/phosphomannose isomerase (EC 5.3.1.8|nr:bifunctional phosphoglucose/phosphomannose isomerase [Calorimonas adulescens]
MHILDDLNKLQELDKEGMLDAVYHLPEQMEEALSISEGFNFKASNIKNVVVSGMGGSAIGGDLVRVYLMDRVRIPILVNRAYSIPAFVDGSTLFIASSYSGNTEETLSTYAEAKQKGAQIVAITTGGKLKEMALADGYPVLTIPAGYQPRAAIGYSFVTTLMTLYKAGIIDDPKGEINDAIGVLKDLREQLKPEVMFEDNNAKQLADDFYGRLPVIYGSAGTTEIVAQRWKGQMSENGKAMAYYNVFSELNHNEIVGFEFPKELLKKFVIVYLQDDEDHPRIKRRMEITREIIEDAVYKVDEVQAVGGTRLARLFSLIYIGDYTSVYLAFLNGTDPSPVKRISYLKDQLAK